MTLYLMLFVNTVFFACISSSSSLILCVDGCKVLTIRSLKYPSAPVVYGQVILFVAIFLLITKPTETLSSIALNTISIIQIP